jgi:hypothetical protein
MHCIQCAAVLSAIRSRQQLQLQRLHMAAAVQLAVLLLCMYLSFLGSLLV